MFVTVALLAVALVILTAVVAAAGAGTLARIDGASYPAAIKQAAITFAAVLTLASTLTAALTALIP
ncbi:hypothetical protein [Streptomyces sp. NPDC059209]|uniref:hypothetical protein n=1 Tax=Streptomyces sp. NPDC059209 TaxID=3346769 RepID=UPI0036876381